MLQKMHWPSTRHLRRKQILCDALWRQMRSMQYAAVVAGAGPAGLAVVGNLLENNIGGKVLWVDPDFQGGRLGRNWREVPSNTKAKLFVDYAKGTNAFRHVLEEQAEPGAVSRLEELPQDKGCSIKHAADMVVELTGGLRKLNEVDTREGKVSGASWNSKSNSWTIEVRAPDMRNHSTVSSSRFVLATGAHPSEIPISVPHLDLAKVHLDTALTPSKLSELLPQDSTIAVIGASHSAILVLLNLYNLATTSHPKLQVRWFTRNPLRYAEYMDGWIKRDNTGLKGIAADFAREHLENLSTDNAGKFITKMDCSGGNGHEQEMYERYLPECTHIVQATGFKPNALPMLSSDGALIAGVKYDHEGGGFVDANGEQVKGLFGAGIAFPERVKDPEGNVEYNVGLFKFMKYLRRVTKDWVGMDKLGRPHNPGEMLSTR